MITRGQAPTDGPPVAGWIQMRSVPVRNILAPQMLWLLPARGRWDVFASTPAGAAEGLAIRSYDQTPGARAPSGAVAAAAEGRLIAGSHRVLAITGRTAPQLVELAGKYDERDPAVVAGEIQLVAYGYEDGSPARGAYRVVQIDPGVTMRIPGAVTRIVAWGALGSVMVDGVAISLPADGSQLEFRPGHDALLNPEIIGSVGVFGIIEYHA